MNNRKFFLIAPFVLILFLSGCVREVAPKLVLKKTDFEYLPGWEKDDQRKALFALKRSCEKIKKQNPDKSFSKSVIQSGKAGDWQKICDVLDKAETKSAEDARRFLKTWFEPYRVYNNSNPEGLFTGYYLPKLKCSLKPSKKYKHPIYALPEDWVMVKLGLFHPELKGRSVVGRVKNKRLVPYHTRKGIVNGALKEKAKVLAWCDDKVDVAFAHIQGSAVVELPNKKQFLINYEGSNGRSYTAIGRVLVKKNELTLENVSMQSIREWFLKNPKKIDQILNKNASYVFFRKLDIKDPLGSQQVPLTPGRSLAVDRKYIQLGIPVWLSTVVPSYLEGKEVATPFQRLLIAQDTGGAIKGIVRGDVYWGSGEAAAFTAGKMKSQGGYWLLLPRNRSN